jgi:hypothetical protein
MPSEFEKEIFAQVAAARLAHRSTVAAILLALAEAKALDISRALALVDTLAAALQQPVGVTDPTSLRVLKLAADEMAEMRPAILKMTSLPPGAGKA